MSKFLAMNKNNIFIVVGSLAVIGVGYVAVSAILHKDADPVVLAATCNQEYQSVLALSNFDNTECAPVSIRTGEFSGTPPSPARKNIFLIVDSSGSMAGIINGRSKMDIAKEAINRFVGDVKGSDVNLSIIVYGHKGSNAAADKTLSCSGIEELYAFGPAQPEKALAVVSALRPVGWTPIAQSLQKASDVLRTHSGNTDRNLIVLVSDGEETCNGDPVGT